MKITGKMSTFGGPLDKGVSPSEGLALIELPDLKQWWFSHLFLSFYPEGTTGLARRLNPYAYYVACRWQDFGVSRATARKSLCKLTANGKSIFAQPADFGPALRTKRVADLSPGAATALGLQTDDVVTVELITP